MFTTESKRVRMWFACAMLSLLAAVLGTWAAEGFLGFVLAACGLLLNVAAVLALPFVDDKFDSEDLGYALGFAAVLGAICGGILWGWWGLAYAVAALVAVLVSSTLSAD